MIRYEHHAMNLPEPHAIARWYAETLDCRILFQKDEAPFTVFLADSQGRVFWEIYSNPQAPMADVRGADPAIYHLAFAVEDPETVQKKIVAAGGLLVDEIRMDNGSHFVMLRDPWGMALQLCRRLPPFLDAQA